MESTPNNNVFSAPNGNDSAEGSPARPVLGMDAPASEEVARQATTTVDSGHQVDASLLPMEPALLAALFERAALTIRASIADKAPLKGLSLPLPVESAPVTVPFPGASSASVPKNLLDSMHARIGIVAPAAESSVMFPVGTRSQVG